MKLRTVLREAGFNPTDNSISHFQQNSRLSPNAQDGVGMIYVVTAPTPDSTLNDICFGGDLSAFALQVFGGATTDDKFAFLKDVLYFTYDKNLAIQKAKEALEASKADITQ